MSWQECSPVELRTRFVTDWASGRWSMTDLCAEYRISRKTGYKWIDRALRDGVAGLADRSRRPHRSPRATDAAMQRTLVAARHRHPRWGARKLLAWLRRQDPARTWPARTTVWSVLARHGLTRERRVKTAALLRRAGPLAAVDAPNDTWTADFKGQFRTRDGTACFPLTIRDAYSRVVLRCDALRGVHLAPTRARFARAFAAYGLPRYIRTDNGTPFVGVGLAGLSRLSAWWIRLGITPERIDPGRPQQNGSHEQFHAVLKAATTRPPATTLVGQQRRFNAFCREYNEERPHEALGDVPPSSRYAASPRAYAAQLRALEYPGHFEVRRVFGNGCVSWHHRDVFITGVLAGDRIGFEEVDDGLWTIHFGAMLLGRFDERTRSVHDLDDRRKP